MMLEMFTHDFLASLWKVLLFFLIPIGGGIPAGVVLAQKSGFSWQLMELLYLISDIILACSFEPLLHLFVLLSKRSAGLTRFREEFSKSMKKTISHYGVNPGPFNLVMITFGTDPMTGRTVAMAAGHGFITGWALTICGDMLFFTVLMASTLWLNNILGDGTLTAMIIMGAMLVFPPLVRWVKSRWWKK